MNYKVIGLALVGGVTAYAFARLGFFGKRIIKFSTEKITHKPKFFNYGLFEVCTIEEDGDPKVWKYYSIRPIQGVQQ